MALIHSAYSLRPDEKAKVNVKTQGKKKATIVLQCPQKQSHCGGMEFHLEISYVPTQDNWSHQEKRLS
jgi:hypothetical protein